MHIIVNRYDFGSDYINKQFLWRFIFSAVFVLIMLYIYKDRNNPMMLLLAATPWRAACVIGVLFGVCALGVFPPLSLIYLLCGTVLPFYLGLTLCVVGSALVFSFSYFMGRHRSNARLPAAGGFYTALVLRCVRITPCKTVGLYMGSAGFPFWSYLFGSLLGSMPSILVSLVITK